MTRFLPQRIIAAAALLVIALTGLVLHEESLRRSGREVLLAIEAVDPRDLLTGHYAALDIREAIAPDAPCPPGVREEPATSLLDARVKQRDWIALAPKGDHFVAVGADRSRAKASALALVTVWGVMTCNTGFVKTGENAFERPGSISLDLGVKRFHADQKQAEIVSAQLRGGPDAPPAFAVISVGNDGKARLRGLMIGGKRLTLTWF